MGYALYQAQLGAKHDSAKHVSFIKISKSLCCERKIKVKRNNNI